MNTIFHKSPKDSHMSNPDQAERSSGCVPAECSSGWVRMKISFLLLFCLLIVFSCEGKKSNVYTITGTVVPEFEGKTIYLIRDTYISGGEETSDSTLIQSGSFVFSGEIDEPYVGTIVIKFPDEKREIWRSLLIETGLLSVQIEKDEIFVAGTPANDVFQAYLNFAQMNYEKFQSSQKNLTGTPEEIGEKSEANLQVFIQRNNEMNMQLVEDHLNNPLAQKIFYETYRDWPFDQFDRILHLYPPSAQTKPPLKEIAVDFESVKKVQVGQTYIDFKLKNLDGKDVALSDYINKKKYTLLFFWSPDCYRCHDDLIVVSDLYGKYHKKGFEAIGISLDCNKEKCVEITKEYKITWPQVLKVCDGSADVGKAYVVTFMPLCLLLDQDGTIVERGQKIIEFKQKIEDLLK